MTSTKLIIAALMVPVFTLTALVMAAAAVARSVGRALADNVLLGTGRHPEDGPRLRIRIPPGDRPGP
jgi:hypothetical protein